MVLAKEVELEDEVRSEDATSREHGPGTRELNLRASISRPSLLQPLPRVYAYMTVMAASLLTAMFTVHENAAMGARDTCISRHWP
jgi:demethoxyubiquinone hydroxylase (CLK1/Coq7/Cat5 family)